MLLEVVDHGRADEGGLRELDREAGGRPGRTVVVGPGEALHRLVEFVRVGRHVVPPGGQPAPPGRGVLFPGVLDQWPEPGQHALVAEEARIAGRDGARIDRRVGVAEEDGVVPHVPGDQGNVGEPGVERGAVEQRTVPVLIRPGVKAGPRRAAGRRVGPMVGEEHAAAGQRIERGRLQQGVAQCGQAVAPPLVEGDEEHVARGRHGDTLADGRRSSWPMCRCRCGGAEVSVCRCRGAATSRHVWVRRCADCRRADPRVRSRRPDGGAAGGSRAHEVRMDAPPRRVPKSMSQAPRRGALTRCTARPPVTGIPAAERCVARGSRVEAATRRATCHPPAVSSRSRRWADAIDSTALPWIIASSPL